jgi:uncharacterized damage-inducible protein DinB
MGKRAEVLAERIAQGHRELIAFVEACSEADWRTDCPNEGWTVGVVVHHVASMLPAELDVIKTVASGQPVISVTAELVDQINAQHAKEYADCSREETLDLLRRNSALVVSAIREMSDAELDQAAPVSLHSDAPVTAQYLIEDHPLGHAYDHLTSVRAALGADTHL